jgi:superfamily II DNA/RNA helicase
MIVTEAAAEDINLQFCSMVVNYDLPWNPQRIEQRIGRCHRYGQRYDVVVVNFLNKNNAADQLVHQLLAEKFELFSGVFGASDEVLGAIESDVEFEKRIVSIYQNCRSTEEIETEFEVAHLRLFCDEIFGSENFVEQVSWKNKYGAGAKTKGFIEVHEYILCYSRNPIENIESNLSDEQKDEYKLRDEKYAARGGYVTQPLMTAIRTNFSHRFRTTLIRISFKSIMRPPTKFSAREARMRVLTRRQSSSIACHSTLTLLDSAMSLERFAIPSSKG